MPRFHIMHRSYLHRAKVKAHVAQTIAANPELVQISTAYGSQKDGSPLLPRNKYTAIWDGKPKSQNEAKRPEFKVCKFTTEGIITEGADLGTVHKVCVNRAAGVKFLFLRLPPKTRRSDQDVRPDRGQNHCGEWKYYRGNEPRRSLISLELLSMAAYRSVCPSGLTTRLGVPRAKFWLT